MDLIVRHLECLQAYADIHRAMVTFTEQRSAATTDEFWLLQHDPVFTQGQAGKTEHLLNPGTIPVVATDRGGQVTYHGPGQWLLYVLLDLRRQAMGVKDLVSWLEQGVIQCLAGYGIQAYTKARAPGVYVQDDLGEAKIASLGLRIRQGRSFHGLALNVDMMLEPFCCINPCGYVGLRVTDLAHVMKAKPDILAVAQNLIAALTQSRGYSKVQWLRSTQFKSSPNKFSEQTQYARI